MRIYIVIVKDKETKTSKVSAEAYFNLENAQRFIENRYGKPERISPMRYETKNTIYLITDVLTVDEKE